MSISELKCWFSDHVESIPCGYMANEKTVSTLCACKKNISGHLQSLHLPKTDVCFEWQLILLRSGHYDFSAEFIKVVTVRPAHRYNLGLNWKPSRSCLHPLHGQTQKKATRGVVKQAISREVYDKWKVVLPVGSGLCRDCYDGHKTRFSEVTLGQVCEQGTSQGTVAETPSTLAAAATLLDTSISTPSTSTYVQVPVPEMSTPISESVVMDESSLLSPEETTQTELDTSWAPTPAPKKGLHILNDFLEESGCEPVRAQLKQSLDTVADSTKRYYKTKAKEAFGLVLHYLAPHQEDALMNAVQSKDLPGPMNLDILVKCYNEAKTWYTKRQILSIFAHSKTKKELLELIPDITVSRIDAARKHAKEVGDAQPVELHPIFRTRLNDGKVDHFLNFLSRPEFTQDVAYGTRKMKLSHGEVLEIPNVVRTVISSRIIDLYENYCSETKFEHLKRTTLYNILNICASSKKKSLAGLDNIAADGASAFETMKGVAEKLIHCGKSQKWSDDMIASIRATQLYLKTDYKMHIKMSSECADHCLEYSLAPKPTCKHVHNVTCDHCDGLRLFIRIQYDFDSAKDSLYNLKSHILRTINQERGKQDILQSLKPNQSLITMDWAMKFLPCRFRESMQEWYGKKGISWHVSAAVTKPLDSEDYVIHCFVHFIDRCTQNWYSVLCIIEAVLKEMKNRLSYVTAAHLRSDNAGCYHCAPLILSLQALSDRLKISIPSYDFSESQAGKDLCDRKIASLKSHIQRFVNEGNDILSAQDMYEASTSYGGVRGCYTSVLNIDDSAMIAEKITWSGIASFTNFKFEATGVCVWKAYGIGDGQLFKYEKLKNYDRQLETKFTLSAYSEPRMITGIVAQKDREQGTSSFHCTEEGCTKTFRTENSLTRHLAVGIHSLMPVTDTKYDEIARKWSARVGEVVASTSEQLVTLSDISEPATASVKLDNVVAGWALKTAKSHKRFSENVKSYLLAEFNKGVETGRKEDPRVVSKRMKAKFTKPDWLTTRQIASYFSRLSSLQKCGKIKEAGTIIDNEEKIEQIDQMVTRTRLRNAVIAQMDE